MFNLMLEKEINEDYDMRRLSITQLRISMSTRFVGQFGYDFGLLTFSLIIDKYFCLIFYFLKCMLWMYPHVHGVFERF